MSRQPHPFTWDEWMALDATAMATHIASGDVTPAEVAAQARAAAERVNPEINAVLEIFDDVVEDPYCDGMAQNGLFHGVPMLLKDLASGMRGRLQEEGAVFMKGNIHEADDSLTLNWRKVGFNLVGRTSCPMFGSAGVTDSLIHGITRNPWNPDRTPSGSSGGSAAAVAAGIVPIASASDGGGSTRSPAGYTGLIGLKPTRGRLPLPLGMNEYSHHYVVEGVLTRSVRDTARALDAMAQVQPGESIMPIAAPARPYIDECEGQDEELRIALLTGVCGRDGCADAEVIEAVTQTAMRLESLGHMIEPIDDASLCDWDALFHSVDVTWIGNAQFWPGKVRSIGREITADNIESVFWHLIEYGRRFGLDDAVQAKDENAMFTRQFGECFEAYDLILSPVEAVTAPRCGPEAEESPLHPVDSPEEANEFVQRMTSNGRYMVAANEAGFPAISVPSGMDSNGVPIGAQLAAAWGGEDLLIRVAAQLEAAHAEVFNRRPAVSI